MQALQIVTKHQGFTLTQVERGPAWAIYAQTKDSFKDPNRVICFEAFHVKVAPARKFPSGSDLPEREVYPGDNAFGKTAWCCPSIERAKFRLGLIPEQTPAIRNNAPTP